VPAGSGDPRRARRQTRETRLHQIVATLRFVIYDKRRGLKAGRRNCVLTIDGSLTANACRKLFALPRRLLAPSLNSSRLDWREIFFGRAVPSHRPKQSARPGLDRREKKGDGSHLSEMTPVPFFAIPFSALFRWLSTLGCFSFICRSVLLFNLSDRGTMFAHTFSLCAKRGNFAFVTVRTRSVAAFAPDFGA
jgi:hypothetical protein